MSKPYAFSLQFDVEEDTGRILAAFFRVRTGKPARAREFANGSAFAHYNVRGELLGIELLGPCKITVLDKIIAREAAVKRFIHGALPREMLLSA